MKQIERTGRAMELSAKASALGVGLREKLFPSGRDGLKFTDPNHAWSLIASCPSLSRGVPYALGLGLAGLQDEMPEFHDRILQRLGHELTLLYPYGPGRPVQKNEALGAALYCAFSPPMDASVLQNTASPFMNELFPYLKAVTQPSFELCGALYAFTVVYDLHIELLEQIARWLYLALPPRPAASAEALAGLPPSIRSKVPNQGLDRTSLGEWFQFHLQFTRARAPWSSGDLQHTLYVDVKENTRLDPTNAACQFEAGFNRVAEMRARWWDTVIEGLPRYF